MRLTLREEILVVLDYEGLVHAGSLIKKILHFRKSNNDTHLIEESELAKLLYALVEEEYMLEPWVRLVNNRQLYIRVGDLRGEDPFGRDPLKLSYRLTPRGWKLQRSIMNSVVQLNENYPEKKAGKSTKK